MNRFFRATSSAIKTFRQAWNGVKDDDTIDFSLRQNLYEKRWQYYNNTAYLDLSRWRQEKGDAGLYRFHRQIYNPVNRLVEFYVSSVYPGVLTADARRIPDGTPLAIPLASDTSPQLRECLGVLWEWSNWQDNMAVYMRYAASTGDVLVEVIDDVDAAKVYFQVMWPGLVKDLELDVAGNVRAYEIEYYTESDGRTLKYNKRVSREAIEIRYDDQLVFSEANAYGFAPAIWYRFTNLGNRWGAPAFWSSIPKIDSLNDVASQIIDQVNKVLVSPILITGANSVRPLSGSAAGKDTRPPTDELTQPQSRRYDLDILTGPEGADMKTLPTNVHDALQLVESLIAELEADYPEIVMYRQLREMTQTTGPAVDRLAGDSKNRFTVKAACSDRQMVKLFQMGVAVAGFRANTGAWGSALDYKRERFRAFDLESYNNGELDFDIDMRPLMPYGRGEYFEIELQRWQAIQAGRAAGMPLAKLLRDEGWDEQSIDELVREYDTPLEKKVKEQTAPKQTADVGSDGSGGANNLTKR